MVVLRSNASKPSDDAREANKVKRSFVLFLSFIFHGGKKRHVQN